METPTETTTPDVAPQAPAPTPAPAQMPSIGRVVHYYDTEEDGETSSKLTLAAIVTAVHGPTSVNLCVFSKHGGSYSVTSASQGTSPGCWAWPPRV